MSRCLSDRSLDHAVLERGEIAHSWRTERWGSLRLLTPNWQSRLPGYGYSGDDPYGYRTVPESSRSSTVTPGRSRPRSRPTPMSCRCAAPRRVISFAPTRATGDAGTLVIASGACNIADTPGCAERVPRSIAQALTAQQYRNPGEIADGGVLVVGASASGTNIADEIHRSGRPVTLAVGEHIRAPPRYRAGHLEWWMDAAGVLDERYDALDDIARARRVPSFCSSPARPTGRR